MEGFIMHHQTVVVLSLALAVCVLPACDLVAPTDRPYNSAAHPPATGQLLSLGFMPGEPLAGQIFFTIDTAYRFPTGTEGEPIMVDGAPLPGGYWISGRTIGFDTRTYPDASHTLTVGLMKSSVGPRETGLLGYLGVPDMIVTGQMVLRQTSPYQVPVQPFIPWDNSFRGRPAVDPPRDVLYVMEQDSVKAFSMLTNAVLRSHSLTGPYQSAPWGARFCALSADATRLFVYAPLNTNTPTNNGWIIALDALTFDSLAGAYVDYQVYGLACGEGNTLYVDSYSSDLTPVRTPLLRVLNATTLAEVTELALPGSGAEWMAMSNDRKTLFFASDEISRVSVETGVPLLQAHRKTSLVSAIGCSSDGQNLFIGLDPSPLFGVTYLSRLTIASAGTLDSVGYRELGSGVGSLEVFDILPSDQEFFAVLNDWPGYSTSRVVRYTGLNAMTASWEFSSYPLPYPLQLSGDKRSLYITGGAMCIPLP
jgi:hypothetical protein